MYPAILNGNIVGRKNFLYICFIENENLSDILLNFWEFIEIKYKNNVKIEITIFKN